MNGNQSVTANFALIPALSQMITVTVKGSGTVTSSPSGMSCSSTCSYPFANGTVVTLTSTPNTGMTFMNWTGGGCSGKGTCQMTMSSTQNVTATFMSTYTLIMPAINLLLLQ
jgi:hypothetical protein